MNRQAVTDDDLLLSDPEKLPGVVLEIAEGVVPVRLLDEGYRSQKLVRCSFCKQRQRHNWGFLILLSDGQKALCGQCCAEKFADKTIVANISKSVVRQVELSKRREMSAAATAGIPELTDLLDREFCPVEERVEDVVRELNRLIPSMFFVRLNDLRIAQKNCTILLQKAVEKRPSDRDIMILLARRRGAQMKALEGMTKLRCAIGYLDLSWLRDRVPEMDEFNRYNSIELDGNQLVLTREKRRFAGDEIGTFRLEIPQVTMPDTTRLEELTADVREAQ